MVARCPIPWSLPAGSDAEVHSAACKEILGRMLLGTPSTWLLSAAALMCTGAYCPGQALLSRAELEAMTRADLDRLHGDYLAEGQLLCTRCKK